MNGRLRRVAVHRAVLDGVTLDNAVLEIVEGRVVNHYRLVGEPAFTEWLGGTAILERDEECGVLRAFMDGKIVE